MSHARVDRRRRLCFEIISTATPRPELFTQVGNTKLGQRGYAVHEQQAQYITESDPDPDTDPDTDGDQEQTDRQPLPRGDA